MNPSSVREFTMSSIFFSWFDYKFIFFSQTHSQFTFFLEFTIFLANSQWIHYVLSIKLWCSIYFAFCLWIHYQFRLDLTINALFIRVITMDSLGITRYEFVFTNGSAEFTMNLLSFSRIHNKNTIFFANWLWLQYFFRWSTMYFQFFSLTNYGLTNIIAFANSLWFHSLFHKFTINSQYF